MPFALIPFLLLAIPIVEIAAFIVIGNQIGVWLTLLMILVTAVIGSLLLRHQGLGLINTIRSEMDAGRVPGKALADGAMIVLAGIFLLTPGFVTDTLGFLLFVPPVRSWMWKFIASRITIVGPGGIDPFAGQSDNQRRDPFHSGRDTDNNASGPVIDLDADDYQSRPANPRSPWNKTDN